MPSWGDIDTSELKALRERLQNAMNGGNTEMLEQLAQEIGKSLLRRVKRRTPVGTDARFNPKWLEKHKGDTHHGDLREKWYLEISPIGKDFIITIANDVFYAPYVEFGHRQEPGRYVPALGKSLKRSWVPGKFMMKISVDKVMKEAPAVITRYLLKHLEKILGE